ncbi:hypothetical protein [Xanthocytophaga flava]|uniref:hypothetical protein n=1 Tax=Xanthocytophaga flava TaxID=3048013 RepID=UPI0028D37A81|nr:hypothetical protein [Xanthocytophaga flavus]MDJ1468072.1 hypothetical protein [Xanthocytophaga flavus]
MRKNPFIYRIFTLLLVVTFLASCKKDDEVKPAKEEDFASAQATISLTNEVNDIGNMAIDFSGKISSDTKLANIKNVRTAIEEGTCGVIDFNWSEASGNIIVTVDYGTGTTCNGIVYKGKLVFTYTYTTNGLNATINFVDYEADGKKLRGDYIMDMSYVKTEAKAGLKYDWKFQNAVFTYADGSTVKWNSAYSISISGATYNTTGGISGTGKDGKNFSATITSPLSISEGCQYGLVSGTYLIKGDGHPDATYDFGDGTCDNKATLTINGTTQTFTFE